MALPPPPSLSPLLITQSNHSLPTSSGVVQVARLWDETEALLASINVPITSLMWCSPDSKGARAHQSSGEWRRGRGALAARGASVYGRASDISTSNGLQLLRGHWRCAITGGESSAVRSKLDHTAGTQAVYKTVGRRVSSGVLTRCNIG